MGAVLLVASLAAHGEVSTDTHQGTVGTIIMGVITDDSDPISVTWQPFRPIPPERILNPSGHDRGDGRADLAYTTIGDDPDPTGYWPIGVWAYNTGTDHDVAFAEWTGAAWSPIEFLTAGIDDDLDPRIFVEPDGTVHVVWWTDAALDRIFLATRAAGSSAWEMPVEVASGGRRPSVAVFDGALRVSCERQSSVPAMAQDVVVLRQEAGGSFAEEFVTSTTRTERLDAVLHATSVKLWLDWKHGAQVFGCAEYDQGAWGSVGQAGWPDPSWVGVEGTRKAIQAQVVGN